MENGGERKKKKKEKKLKKEGEQVGGHQSQEVTLHDIPQTVTIVSGYE